MIRLLLVALAGWTAWRYRSHLKRYANELPQVQRKVGEALSEAAEGLARGIADSSVEPGRKGRARP